MKKNHYCYIAKDFMDFFVEMMVKMLALANDEKMECNLETVCYLCGGTFN